MILFDEVDVSLARVLYMLLRAQGMESGRNQAAREHLKCTLNGPPAESSYKENEVHLMCYYVMAARRVRETTSDVFHFTFHEFF